MIARIRIRAPRRAMSMAEVLVALFLLALGTIAILTMFPLGMYHMGQALKDDRTAQAANQADAIMRWHWRTNVVESGGGGEPLVAAFTNPDATGVGGTPFVRNVPVIGGPGPSYPVFVDPMGWHAPWAQLNSPYQQAWVGYSPQATLPNLHPNFPPYYPRRTFGMLLSQPATMSQRVCSMLDGFGYEENGTPVSVTGVPGGQFERDLRYNWMWILQRPDNMDPNTANMTVVVFDKRAFQFAAPNAEQPFFSGATPATQIPMIPGTTVLQIPKTQGTPPVQKGGWIMDATYQPSGPPAPGGMRHAIFYRVVSVTDNPNNVWNLPAATVVPTTDLELQTPIRRLDGSTGAYSGTLMYFTGVSEVFERPNLRANDY